MRNVLPFLVSATIPLATLPLAVLLTPLPALAQDKPLGAPVQTLDKTDRQRIDELFVELKKAPNDKAAGRVASRLVERMNNSGSASVDLMMSWAQKAMTEEKWDVALDFLDQVTTLKPDYAEGWNRRATVHFLMHNFAKSMADIQRTLELEPRHFGALAGMAQILKTRGDKQSALSAYSRVLDVYPMLRDAQNEVSTLSEELAGEAI